MSISIGNCKMDIKTPVSEHSNTQTSRIWQIPMGIGIFAAVLAVFQAFYVKYQIKLGLEPLIPGPYGVIVLGSIVAASIVASGVLMLFGRTGTRGSFIICLLAAIATALAIVTFSNYR
jgi:hypothetical protein